MKAAAVLLTGGASSRMGSDKATLVVNGEALARRAARVLSAVCAPVVEVGPGTTSLRVVREDPPGQGPLAGFLAGAAALATDQPIVLLACDLPFVDESFVRALVAECDDGSAVPIVDGHHQYACSCWSPAAIAAARVAFDEGDRGMHALLRGDDAKLVPADAFAQILSDVDCPDDLVRLGLIPG
jgi:molybdopterin-guanine dinucleotide biosynthesis protein A